NGIAGEVVELLKDRVVNPATFEVLRKMKPTRQLERQHSPIELLREIGSLRERGYSITEIASKTDFSDEYVSAICYLLDHGEERLLIAVERGLMPAGVAIEIARAKDGDVQAALAEAYEKKAIPGNQIAAIRRIVEQR